MSTESETPKEPGGCTREWTDAEVVAHYRKEMDEVMAAHNDVHRAEESRQCADLGWSQAMVRDSFYMDIYRMAEWRPRNNHVTVVMPRGFEIYAEFVEMFRKPQMVWMTPSVGAELNADAVPCPTVKILLVDHACDVCLVRRRAEAEAREPRP